MNLDEKLQEGVIAKAVDTEQGYSKEYTVQAAAEPSYKLDVTDIDHVQRRLKQRHVQM
jgi:amino acid permease